MLQRLLAGMIGLLMLAGCGVEPVFAPEEFVRSKIYRHDGPPRLTLYTMINNSTGAGAHTSLMVNGSQRVIFDPAGSFAHETLPERNDVVFGITPAVADVYTRYHARETFHVRVQELDVSPELAEAVLRAVMAYGAVPRAQCALSTSTILSEFFPGTIKRGWYPKKLADDFQTIPGVTSRTLREYDSDDNRGVLANWDPERLAAEKATADAE
ncbi:hypothetical protein EI983_00785 [Roseovarius faecimaris]|uniref:Lipoprotein n=1 Tax=Roseovarius faecimaris TaxID=2494550 RepID=A0A6I6IM85_9RHOB|nr:hypothetical protein [Roseovarius faecimaris]QGX96893.1 hypothetical protein EI983_00785 [Roseovarius faecimaris]